MAKNVGWEAKSNHDGSYTVTVNGKQYYCADTHEFLHFLEDIGERWGIVKFEKDERREFSTGAVRDSVTGKGDMISLPWEALLRLSKHYERGAEHYGRWNYTKGIPISSFIDSACRHLAKYQCGLDDEDHLAAAAFNVLGAMLMENTRPEMLDLPLRKGKKTFEYFETEVET
jgi:hypothetical protein